MEKKWQVLEPAPKSYKEKFPELPETVANLLYHRGLEEQKQIDEFLQPDYSQDIHDPFLFEDMEKAIERIDQAIEKQEKIVVHGDYDADGVSASVVLVSTLEILGAKNVDVFLPHRETDGYGLNKNTINELSKDDVTLIITCDCGASNVEEVDLANEKNIDVIITDHHTVPEIPPKAFAMIHPLSKDEPYPDKGLAGGAVAFKLAQGLLKKHKEIKDGWEKWMLDMVAIASVADMVSLTGESRTLTKYGLLVLNKTKRIGLQKLLLATGLTDEEGKFKRELTSESVSFQLAPRINAAGRMNHANVAYNLMMTQDETEATKLAEELDNNNKDRQQLTEKLVKEAVEQIEKDQMENPILFAIGEGWSTGIIGLIAGRIKEKYYKPTIVMAINDNEITGSGRSISGFSLIESMQEIKEVFTKFGGHPMACGFTLKDVETLEEFKEKLTEKYNEKTKDLDLTPSINIDAQINLDDINWDFYDVLDKFKPFGVGNERPKYLTCNLNVESVKAIGKENKHLNLMLSQNSNSTKKAIGWSLCNGNNTNWCKELKKDDKIDVVFEIDVNEWNGNRELQLMIVDLKKTDQTN